MSVRESLISEAFNEVIAEGYSTPPATDDTYRHWSKRLVSVDEVVFKRAVGIWLAARATADYGGAKLRLPELIALCQRLAAMSEDTNQQKQMFRIATNQANATASRLPVRLADESSKVRTIKYYPAHEIAIVKRTDGKKRIYRKIDIISKHCPTEFREQLEKHPAKSDYADVLELCLEIARERVKRTTGAVVLADNETLELVALVAQSGTSQLPAQSYDWQSYDSEDMPI